MPLLESRGLEKRFETGGEVTRVLQGLDLAMEEGEMVMVMGPSGCGKTTLLNLLCGIYRPTGVTISVAGQELTCMDERGLLR